MKFTLIALLLTGCATGVTGTNSTASGTFTPTRQVTGPSAGISKRCVPQPMGTGADCTPL
jgi:hypothetical protein